MLDNQLDVDGFLTTPSGSSSFRRSVASLQRSTGIRPITNDVDDEDKFLLKNVSRDSNLSKAKIIQFTNGIYPLSDFGILSAYKGAIKAVEHPEGFIYLTVENIFPRNPLAATYATNAYKKWILSKRPLISAYRVPVPYFAQGNSFSREQLEARDDVFILEQDEYHLRSGRLYIVGYDMRF